MSQNCLGKRDSLGLPCQHTLGQRCPGLHETGAEKEKEISECVWVCALVRIGYLILFFSVGLAVCFFLGRLCLHCIALVNCGSRLQHDALVSIVLFACATGVANSPSG